MLLLCWCYLTFLLDDDDDGAQRLPVPGSSIIAARQHDVEVTTQSESLARLTQAAFVYTSRQYNVVPHLSVVRGIWWRWCAGHRPGPGLNNNKFHDNSIRTHY